MITKRLIQLLVTLFLLVILTIVGLVLFINPNNYKDVIVSKVENTLDRRFAIQGDISWRFWPRLGLAIHDVELGQPKGFTQNNNDTFAKIGDASIYVRIAPLFQKQIDVDKVSIKNATIYLEQDNQRNNWDDLMAAKTSQKKPDVANTAAATNASANQFNVAISAINIENSHIILNDAQAKQTTTINIHNLNTALIDHNNPLDAKLSIDIQPQNIQFNTGIDIEFDYSNLSANGAVTIDQLNVAGLTLSKIAAQMKMQDKIVHLAPLTAQIESGTLTSTATINLQQATPKLNIDATLKQLDLGSLPGASKKFTGILNLHTQFTTSGNSSNNLLQNLNGTADFNIEHGVYHGVDLGYWLAEGEALLATPNLQNLTTAAIDAGVAIARTDTQKTEFTEMSGTFKLQQGVANNQDLKIYNPEFYTAGQGSIELQKQMINYHLQISTSEQTANGYQPKGMQIPLTLTGSLSNPHIGIDKNGLQNLLVKSLGNELKNQLQNAIPALNPNGTTNNAAATPEQVVTDVLKGILGK